MHAGESFVYYRVTQSESLDLSSILYKTRLPFILVFNKTDVTPHEFAIEWMSDFEGKSDIKVF